MGGYISATATFDSEIRRQVLVELEVCDGLGLSVGTLELDKDFFGSRGLMIGKRGRERVGQPGRVMS